MVRFLRLALPVLELWLGFGHEDLANQPSEIQCVSLSKNVYQIEKPPRSHDVGGFLCPIEK
jgi:hypothetical protein